MKLIGYKEDGSEVEIPEKKFAVDGYHFGGRLLEDVMFDVTFDEADKIVKVETRKEDEHYLSGLNVEKWKESAKHYAQRILDQGGDEVDMSPDIMEKYNIVNSGYIE